jgi:hypothetical protein
MLMFACAALVMLAGFYVLTPLFKESKGNLEAELWMETDLDRLLDRKAVIYGNLKDLEFEYKMGRLSETDFSGLEAAYKKEAAAILQQADHLGSESDLDKAVERETPARKIPAAAHCPSCGAEVIAGKKFCADCGRSL